MIIVLDSNEYIGFLNHKLKLEKLFEGRLNIYLCELIVKEVLRNINENQKKEFYKLLFKNNIKIQQDRLPKVLFYNYKKLGLKKGDIFIASFCEYVQAEYLITENRHFLRSFDINKFKITTLNDFISKL